MIIPLSHDSGQVRRQPWVTYGIILSCALVFLMTHVVNGEDGREAELCVESAYEYWSDHPYLEADPRLIQITGDPASTSREEFYAVWEETGEPPLPVRTLEMEQERFDELMQQAFAALDKHPWHRFGLIPSAPTAIGLFTHMFLHGGWLHLIPNMLFLFLTGSFIEDRWGRGLYALFYLAAGVSGAALFVGKYPGFHGPLIGASGAIAGAMGAFLVCFARAKIKFFYWLGIFFGTFSAPAWLMLPLWFANELFTASIMDAINPGGAGGGVAYWAHVGGFGFGVAAAFAVRFSGIEGRISKQLGGNWSSEHASILTDAATARAEGRPEEALELLRFALERDPDDVDLSVAFFEMAVELGRLEEGTAVLAPVIWREVKVGEREAAVSHWQALCDAAARVRAEPVLLLRLAGWLRDAKNPDGASVALRCVLDDCSIDPLIAMRVARLARSFDRATAGEAAEIALQAPGLESAERRALEAIIAASREQPEERGIPLAAPGDGEPTLDLEEQLDHGAVWHSAITAEPEPERAMDFDRTAIDISEISTEASQGAPSPEEIDPLEESPTGRSEGDRFEFFDEDTGELSEKEELKSSVSSSRRTLRVMEAVPRELDGEALWVEVEGKGRTRLPFSRVDAVAAAGVHGMSRKAVILIDLALDWTADAEKPLTVLRLRSDRYDPRVLVGGAGSPLQAIGQLVSMLITRTRAVALPAPDSARGEPFKIFRDLASYEEQVLGAERPVMDDIF
jgi:membrane associated rhomboid family serine protease